MSIIAVIAFIGFCVYLVTRFGKQIHARNATSWWLAIAFLFVGVAYPKAYQYLASLLGIQLVSNFVIAAMLLFLLKTTLENASENTRTARKLREFICSDAARRYANELQARLPADKIHVLVTLPTYNEEENIVALRTEYEKTIAEQKSDFYFHLVFVNDSSSDDTENLLKSHWPGHYTSHMANVGVSGVLLTGFKLAESLNFKYVVQCDSDGQHPLDKIPHIVAEAERTKADILIGSRFVAEKSAHDKLESTTFIRRLGGLAISMALRTFFPAEKITDPTSGFRVYSRQALKVLSKSMPDDYPEPESIALCAQKGLRVVETPVRMRSRQGGETSISGLKSFEFMVKVLTSLLSLRVRQLLYIKK